MIAKLNQFYKQSKSIKSNDRHKAKKNHETIKFSNKQAYCNHRIKNVE